VFDGRTGQILGAAGRDLDDAVTASIGESAQRRVEGLARSHVDRRVGKALLFRAIEHLGVNLGSRDRHGFAPSRQACAPKYLSLRSLGEISSMVSSGRGRRGR